RNQLNETATSDESFTPKRIRGSESLQGTTGSDSDQKEQIRRIGFVKNPRNRIRVSELDSLLFPSIRNY
ncbi:hypothetical protein AVEN_166488-1, partial [Araneus ventricosus]